LDFPGIELVGLVPLGVVAVVLFVALLGEVLDVLEEDVLPVLVVELVEGDVPLLEALLLVVGVVEVVLLLLARGSHGMVLGFVLCGTGVAVCAGGIAVWGVGEAVWACGVAVCGVGDAVCAGGVAVWGVGEAVWACGVAVCAPTDIAIPQSTRSKQVNTLILSFIRGLLKY
jgi:hypothetical protein